MSQETAALEEKEQKQKMVKTAAKRLTVKNVWDELQVLSAKIDTMETIIDASNHAKLEPEILEEDPKTDKILSRLSLLEEKLASVESLGTKMESIESRLEESATVDAATAAETKSSEEIEAQLEALGRKIDSLYEELAEAKKKAETAPSEEPTTWSGVFSIGASVAAGGAILSAIPGVSLIAAIGLVCVGGFLSAISALRLWFRPKKREEPTA